MVIDLSLKEVDEINNKKILIVLGSKFFLLKISQTIKLSNILSSKKSLFV